MRLAVPEGLSDSVELWLISTATHRYWVTQANRYALNAAWSKSTVSEDVPVAMAKVDPATGQVKWGGLWGGRNAVYTTMIWNQLMPIVSAEEVAG